MIRFGFALALISAAASAITLREMTVGYGSLDDMPADVRQEVLAKMEAELLEIADDPADGLPPSSYYEKKENQLAQAEEDAVWKELEVMQTELAQIISNDLGEGTSLSEVARRGERRRGRERNHGNVEGEGQNELDR